MKVLTAITMTILPILCGGNSNPSVIDTPDFVRRVMTSDVISANPEIKDSLMKGYWDFHWEKRQFYQMLKKQVDTLGNENTEGDEHADEQFAYFR